MKLPINKNGFEFLIKGIAQDYDLWIVKEENCLKLRSDYEDLQSEIVEIQLIDGKIRFEAHPFYIALIKNSFV